MPIQNRLCRAGVTKQHICCYIFASVTVLLWGIFLISASLTYENSFVWKEVVLFLGCVVSAGSFISLLANLAILFRKKMCCYQKHFVICDSYSLADSEEQLESSNQGNAISQHCNETSFQCEQANTLSLAEEYSDISIPSSSSVVPTVENHIEKSNQRELGLQSQPFYMSQYENLPLVMHGSKMNLSVPTAAEFSPQQKIRSKFPSDIPSVYFERSPTMKSSQELAAASSQQSEVCNRNLGISNKLYMAGYETEHNHSDAKPLYENVQSLLCSDKIQNTISKELNTSGTSPPIYFDLENISPKHLTSSDKSKLKHFNEVTMAENTIAKELVLSSMCSPKYVNSKTTVENTIHKELAFCRESSPRYVNVNPAVENTSPKNLTEPSACSPIHVNTVLPKIKNTNPKHIGKSETSPPRSRLI